MKLSIIIAIAMAMAAKANADCFSTRLGYPCCQNTKDVAYTDDDGQWGYENGNWCGLGGSNDNEQCTGQKDGYKCCNTCNVYTTDNQGAWGLENGDWCGIKKSCNAMEDKTIEEECTGQKDGYKCCNICNVYTTDSQGAWGLENNDWCGIKKSCSNNNPVDNPIDEPVDEPKYPNIPDVLPEVNNGKTGRTTRYWDCCVASCSWYENTLAPHAVNACDKDGKTIFQNFNYKIGSICDAGTPQKGYMCNDNQPWALTDNLSYGFAAASFTSGTQKEWCCSCYRLQFTSKEVKDKQMVVQVTNTGYDLTNNHFDIQMPGGGVGIYNGCSAQWGAGQDGWGKRYGGVESVAECNQLPAELQDACKWRFNWFKNADNPEITFERVQCPTELTDITGCIPVDDASQKKLPWLN